MHEFTWMDHLPGGVLEGGIMLANRLYWNIAWTEADRHWRIWSGERLVLQTDSKEVAEAFIYGMGLAYAVFPEGLFEQLERAVKGFVDPETDDTSSTGETAPR